MYELLPYLSLLRGSLQVSPTIRIPNARSNGASILRYTEVYKQTFVDKRPYNNLVKVRIEKRKNSDELEKITIIHYSRKSQSYFGFVKLNSVPVDDF